MNQHPSPAGGALTFHLDHFDGPLDLLLHLIEKNKIDIYDIPIAQILTQYMQALDQAAAADLEIAGDFIAMAAQLVLIKSKMLLPRHDQAAEEDPRAELVELLLEYQRIKLAAPFLQQQGERGYGIFTRPPTPLPTARPAAYQHTPADLVRTGRALLRRAERRVPPPADAFTGIVGREKVPVEDKIAHILQLFAHRPWLQFARLFDGVRSRPEAVATFLAVLELSKTHRIDLEGQGMDLTLRLRPPGEEAEAE